MIVPITSAKGATMAPVPSQTNLLMALATMHKLGRFNSDDDSKRAPKVPKMPEIGGET